MELTPRTLEDDRDLDAPARRPRRRWLPMAIVALVVVALGALVFKGLNEATVYFRTADEAVAQREQLGDRRFRLEGTVQDDVAETPDGVNFDVTHNGVAVAVHHVGDPPDLFQPGEPVVLEGRWDPSGAFFASDRMLVKHDASYESRDDYQQRMSEAEQDGGG